MRRHLEPHPLETVHSFVKLPTAVLVARNLSPIAKLVYAGLVNYAWQDDECFPGEDRLANDLCVTPKTIRRGLADLVAAGFVEQRRRGLGRTNIYTLAPLPARTVDFTDQERSELPFPERSELPTNQIVSAPLTAPDVTATTTIQQAQPDAAPQPKAKTQRVADPVSVVFRTIELALGRLPSQYTRRWLAVCVQKQDTPEQMAVHIEGAFAAARAQETETVEDCCEAVLSLLSAA